MSNEPMREEHRTSKVSTRPSRASIAALNVSAVPSHIVLFKKPSEDNEKALNDVMRTSMPPGTAELRSGARLLETEDGRDVRLYRPLGVAAATLTDEEIEGLLGAGVVRNVYRNGTRHLPRPVQIQLIGHDQSMQSTLRSAAVRSVDRDLIAYMRGQRDSIDNFLRYAGEQIEIAPHVRQGPMVQQTGERSWCLDMIGVTATTETGSGIVVAVLDTGMDLQHPDLARHFNAHPDNFETFVGQPVQDHNGHGTHCCGVVAGAVKPMRGPRYGVAPDVTLLAGKVLKNSGSGRDDQIIEGLMWAATKGAHIISLSLGSARSTGDLPDEAYDEIGENLLKQRNILLVAATGNESDRESGMIAPVGDPAASPHYLAVAAIDRERRIGWFSCAGPEVGIAAPGLDVYAAYKGGTYAKLDGTSMATPHVAGAAAIWAQRTGKRGEELRNLVKSKALLLPLSAEDGGAGLVRV